MPPNELEEIIIHSKTLDKSLGLAQKIGKNREKISLGRPQQIGENEFIIKIIRGTIEDFRDMIRGIPSIRIIKETEAPKEIEVNLDSYLPDAQAKPEKQQPK